MNGKWSKYEKRIFNKQIISQIPLEVPEFFALSFNVSLKPKNEAMNCRTTQHIKIQFNPHLNDFCQFEIWDFRMILNNCDLFPILVSNVKSSNCHEASICSPLINNTQQSWNNMCIPSNILNNVSRFNERMKVRLPRYPSQFF